VTPGFGDASVATVGTNIPVRGGPIAPAGEPQFEQLDPIDQSIVRTITRDAGASSEAQPGVARLFLLGLGTRIAVILAGIAFPQRWADANVVVHPRLYAMLSSGWHHWIEPWFRWDACHYMNIGLFGYSYPSPYTDVAFMPLLPMFVALGRKLSLDPIALGLLIPNLAFAIGLPIFGRLAFRVTRDARTSWRACILLCSFPTAFFFSAPYQESLGFLFTVIALWGWKTDRKWVAVPCMAIAATGRQAALATALAFPIQWARDFRNGSERRRDGVWAWSVLAAAVLGIASVACFMYWKFGDPFLGTKVQSAWGRSRPSPLNILRVLRPESFRPSYLVDYATMLLMLLLSLRSVRRGRVLLGSASGLPIVLAMSTGIALSMKRYALSSFTAFIEAAEILTDRRLFWIAVAFGTLLQASLLYSYVNWGFSSPQIG
jgi:hypothetical protein